MEQLKKSNAPYEIEKYYFIRTVTMNLTGRLVAVYERELVLEDAAWIPSSGRFGRALISGDFDEVEPFPEGRQVIVGRGALVDAVVIDRLPRSEK
ncbi:hypothetical protein UFOVP1299_74 [uncultured Caudovirales phage]|uniref:Uncharacterized protein n=1 Tax=uncultured Caudovirales phage TaxID=2100421 RepID=A0A6J5RWJ4_9CAUD|nr:hypothetical protein UFOVP1299_74 [uncultured Caudovirales phage]